MVDDVASPVDPGGLKDRALGCSAGESGPRRRRESPAGSPLDRRTAPRSGGPVPGGLVSALTAVLQNRNGLWIGWPGTSEHGDSPTTYEGIRLKAARHHRRGVRELLPGFSNATLWPLYHDAIRAPTFHRHWWQAYTEVNMRFADVGRRRGGSRRDGVGARLPAQLVPQMLRQLRPDVHIGFFLHIPFPPIELFMQLPWRREILAGLLGADLIGFQVTQAASNFSRMARRQSPPPAPIRCSTTTDEASASAPFPISVDCEQIITLAERSVDPRPSQRDSQRSRRPRADPARRGPTRLHQGHPAAHQGRLGNVPRRITRVGQARDGPSRRAEPRDRRALRTRTPQPRTGRQRDERRVRTGRQSRRFTTCTRTCPSPNWWRSTSRPTSCWSRHFATA